MRTKRLGAYAASCVFAALAYGAEPANVIFDTDMYTDFDDVGALAVLHALADAGECRIIAVGCNTYGPGNKSVAACEVINAYYGRADLTVGCSRSGGRKGPGANGHDLPMNYPQWVRHMNTADAPLAVDVYRAALEKAQDKSVVICTVGYMNNVADLMKADMPLIKRKVRLWSCMACSYPTGKECNSMYDPVSSDYAFSHWPKDIPIVWIDFQYGIDCYSGRAVAELPVKGNPVKDAFALRLQPRHRIVPPGHPTCKATGDQMAGHPSWDELAVLIAVRGTDRYFNVDRGSYRMVGTEGQNEWVPDSKSINCRVTEKLPKAEVGRVIDELLCRPPAAQKRTQSGDRP